MRLILTIFLWVALCGVISGIWLYFVPIPPRSQSMLLREGQTFSIGRGCQRLFLVAEGDLSEGRAERVLSEIEIFQEGSDAPLNLHKQGFEPRLVNWVGDRTGLRSTALFELTKETKMVRPGASYSVVTLPEDVPIYLRANDARSLLMRIVNPRMFENTVTAVPSTK